MLANLLDGFVRALSLTNLGFLVFGGTLGTILGMLPGLGPATGVAVLLPLTFILEPDTAMITLSAIYYGAMFGGSRSSILINTPGAGSAIAATFDGYPMTENGEAESALAMSAIASLIGGLISVVFMAFLAQPIAGFAIKFGSAEMFMLMLFAFSATVSITRGSPLKGLISLSFGLIISTVGQDLQTGVVRFTFGLTPLQSGIDFLIVIIGIYAIGEVLYNFESIHIAVKKVQKSFDRIWVTMDEFKRCIIPILRGTPVGFIIGVLPGSGGTLGSLIAYNTEKQLNKNGDKFGTGMIEGVASPEAANNAAATGALIPLLTLGIPGSGTTAVMMGALMMLGLQPGPLLFENQSALVWTLIASMIIGNIVVAIINLPFAEILVRVLAVPKKILFTIILGLGFLGTYTFNYNNFDLYILIVFGILGYLMKKYKFPITPLILAAIIGGQTENAFRRALQISGGNFGVFFQSTISWVLFVLALLSAAAPFFISHISTNNSN